MKINNEELKIGYGTFVCIPPDIGLIFNKDLLSMPTPKFCDDEEDFFSWYESIKHKIKTDEEKILEQEFLEIYERIKKKKEDPNRKSPNRSEAPFNRSFGDNKVEQEILRRIRHRVLKFKLRKNH